MKKCSSCKADNPDGAKFCRKCGKPLKTVSSSSTKKPKNKKAIYKGTALAIALAGGIGFSLYDNTPERQYQKNIAMGEKYLEKYNFEKAEEYLMMAKSIDPKNEEVYEDLVKVYEAQGETEKVDTVILEAEEALSASKQVAFLSQLESLIEEANQIAEASLQAQIVAKDTNTISIEESPKKPTETESQNDSPSTLSSSQKDSSTTPIPKDEAVAIVERTTSTNDIASVEDIDGQTVTISTSESSQKSKEESVIPDKNTDSKPSTPPNNTNNKDPKDPKMDEPTSSIIPETKVVVGPNTPYTILSEIGALDMVPIALNSDCWIIKKGNEFQFLFPDGSTQKLDSKDQLVLQADPNYSGKTTLLSTACLTDSASKQSDQYYPKEEKVSSCLLDGSEITSYSLEENYEKSSVPVLARSSNQSGYWIYNPADKALYGPFKDSEDTSFYSKINRLSDITLVGHDGQIGGPYWTPAHTTVQQSGEGKVTSSSIKNDDELISKESKSTEESKNSSESSSKQTNTEQLMLWSKDGKSNKTGYTNPKSIDWYSLGAFQDEQFHLLNENLEVVYAGLFDQGGSVINSTAPVQINGSWKLVQFKNIPSSGPATNYSFTNTAKEKEKDEVDTTQTKEDSSDTKNSDTTSSTTTEKKTDSSSSTQSDKTTQKEKDEVNTTQTKEDSSNTKNSDTTSSTTTEKKTDSSRSTQSDKTTQKEKNQETSSSTSSTDTKNSTSSFPSAEKKNYFLKDEDSNVSSINKTTADKDTDNTKSENFSTSSQEKRNYFEKENEVSSSPSSKLTTKSESTTTDKTKTSSETKTTSNKDKTSISEKSSTKTSTSVKKDKASFSSSKTKTTTDEKTSSYELSKDSEKTNRLDQDSNEEEDSSDEPIYYSFSEFAGTYTVTGEDWSNSFKLHSDGSFEGEFTEVLESDDSESYPNGVIRICSYSGTFSLKDDRLKITSLFLEEEPGEIGVEKEILYEYIGLSDSCMSKGDMFTLYGPGTPYSEFSKKASRWIPTPTTKTTTDFIMVQGGASELAYV